MAAKVQVLYYHFNEIPHQRWCLKQFENLGDCNCIKQQLLIVATRNNGRVPAVRVPPEIRPGE